MLYFDNASTTYVYPEVIEAITEVMSKTWGNPANLYSFGLEAKELIEKARIQVANAIGADAEEIIFTSCASESNAMAISQKKRCFCSPYEHHDIKENKNTSVVEEDYLSKIVSRFRPSDPVTLTHLYEDCIYAHMLVNNETGEIFNLKNKIEKAHKLYMPVLVDATQALGNIPIDVHEMDVDYMSFSFHKVHAPKGIGALYVKKELKKHIKPLIYGTQEFNLRGGTSNVPYIVGAGIAVEKAISEMEFKTKFTKAVRDCIIDGLQKLHVPFIVNEGKNNIPSILNIAFPQITGDAMVLALDNEGFCVSTGSACNSGDLKPSEVLQAMHVPSEYIQGAIRISIGLNNSVFESGKLVQAIAKCYNELRS